MLDALRRSVWSRAPCLLLWIRPLSPPSYPALLLSHGTGQLNRCVGANVCMALLLLVCAALPTDSTAVGIFVGHDPPSPSPHCRCVLPFQVVCGTAHTLCITTRGVFSWGCNDGGRLGTGDQRGRDMPVEVPALKRCRVLQVHRQLRGGVQLLFACEAAHTGLCWHGAHGVMVHAGTRSGCRIVL